MAETFPVESFLIRTVGGPHPGQRIAPSTEMAWPLPNELPDEGGRYVKRTESQLPPQAHDSHVIRGAEYFWEGDEGGPELCAAIGCTNVATHTDDGHPTCNDCMRPMWKANRV